MADGRTLVEVVEYLGYSVSDDFEERLKRNPNHHLKTTKQVKAIVRMCEYWKQYLLNPAEDLSRLISAELIQFDKINCTAIASNSEQRAYVGNHAKVTPILPVGYVTQVNSAGKATIMKGFGSMREDL